MAAISSCPYCVKYLEPQLLSDISFNGVIDKVVTETRISPGCLVYRYWMRYAPSVRLNASGDDK